MGSVWYPNPDTRAAIKNISKSMNISEYEAVVKFSEIVYCITMKCADVIHLNELTYEYGALYAYILKKAIECAEHNFESDDFDSFVPQYADSVLKELWRKMTNG